MSILFVGFCKNNFNIYFNFFLYISHNFLILFTYIYIFSLYFHYSLFGILNINNIYFFKHARLGWLSSSSFKRIVEKSKINWISHVYNFLIFNRKILKWRKKNVKYIHWKQLCVIISFRAKTKNKIGEKNVKIGGENIDEDTNNNSTYWEQRFFWWFTVHSDLKKIRWGRCVSLRKTIKTFRTWHYKFCCPKWKKKLRKN